MRLTDQRDVLVRASENAQASLETLMNFLQSPKFRGQGEDWIRTGEVWPVLRDMRNALVDAIELTGWTGADIDDPSGIRAGMFDPLFPPRR